jgi:hypothetical protein
MTMATDTVRRLEKLEAKVTRQTAVCNCGGNSMIILDEETFVDGVRPETPTCPVHGEPLVVILKSYANVTGGRATPEKRA